MSETKENILRTALDLFAKDGYEAVSVSMIAGKLGITKGALYKHFKNKRDIFESIIKRMSETDYEKAKEHEMPEESIEYAPEAYKNTSADKIITYSKTQFRYWTQEKFSSDFRRMLTLEQYRSTEMLKLYQQYLAGGPLMYMADIFGELCGSKQDAMQTALEFYGPFFLLYSVYDAAEDKAKVIETADKHIDSFIARLNSEVKKG